MESAFPDRCPNIVLNDDGNYRTVIAVVGSDIMIVNQYCSEIYGGWLSVSDKSMSIVEVEAAYKLLHPDAE